MKKAIVYLTIMVTLAVITGCASTNWQSKIGSYTYEDAVRDYGPPDNVQELSNGDQVYSWTTSIGRNWIDKLILVFDADGVLESGTEKRF